MLVILLSALLALTAPITAQLNLATALLVVNFSPNPVTVDMNWPEACINKQFDPRWLRRYYSAIQSTSLVNEYGPKYASLDSFLQGWKNTTGIQHPSQHLAPMSGSITLPGYDLSDHPPFMFFEGEMANKCGVGDGIAFKQFRTSEKGGQAWTYQLTDPPKENWSISRFQSSGQFAIDLGPGGKITVEALVGSIVMTAIGGALAAAAIAAAIATGGLAGVLAFGVGVGGGGWLASMGFQFIEGEMPTDVSKLNATNLVKPVPLGFYHLYSQIPSDARSACVLGESVGASIACRVAGMGLLVQEGGSAVATPLPNVYRGWQWGNYKRRASEESVMEEEIYQGEIYQGELDY